jgi:hypothetical protein
LAALGADRSKAQVAKEARRALHRLNLAGIKAGVFAPVAGPEPGPDRVYACLASPTDGEGTRSITIVRQNRFDTLRLGVFILNEKLGVLDVMGSDPCSMTLWKRYLADANEREERLVPVELAFGQRQIEIAAARNERSKTRLPQRYYMFYNLAVGASEERPRPAQLDPDAVRANPDLLAKSVDLIKLPECETWLFPFQDMRPYALKVIAEERRLEQQRSELEQQQSDLPIMDLGQVQREGTVVSVAMGELLDGSRRALYEERLQYTADILWRADRLEEAQWAVAAALAMSQDSTLPLEQHPFLRAVANRSLDLAVRAERASPSGTSAEEGEAEGSAATTNEAEEYVDGSGLIRRKSGLILPR